MVSNGGRGEIERERETEMQPREKERRETNRRSKIFLKFNLGSN